MCSRSEMGAFSSSIIFPILIFICALCTNAIQCMGESLCIDSERDALTKFKDGLEDPFGRLKSWNNSLDCCEWSGVTCDSHTGYVFKLDLHSPCIIDDWNVITDPGCYILGGRLDSALQHLKHLEYLDLSRNFFKGIPIPDFIGSIQGLKYLNFSYSGFCGQIPYHIGNLSKLQILDVSSLYADELCNLDAKNLDWLKGLSSLRHLELNDLDLSKVSSNWMNMMNSLLLLEELHLQWCGLSSIPQSLPFINFTSLRVFDVGSNNFFTTIPGWVSNITSLHSIDLSNNGFHGGVAATFSLLPNLRELLLGRNNIKDNVSKLLSGGWTHITSVDLSHNELFGELPISLGNITSIITLDLSDNGISGNIPEQIGSLQNLEYFVLSGNQIEGEIPKQIGDLKMLQTLNLSHNRFHGAIPDLSKLISLKELFLDYNHLNGTLLSTIGHLSQLLKLQLSHNSLQGPIYQAHFQNLSHLVLLDTSLNSFTFQLPPDWIPPFQLESFRIRSCHIGHHFPSWLKMQKNIQRLDFSNTSLVGKIPTWFWNITHNLNYLNLSNNIIRDKLPNPFLIDGQSRHKTSYVDLSHNQFWGPMPNISDDLFLLDLSHNNFSGEILPCIYNVGTFLASNNSLSGSIPSMPGHMSTQYILDLSHNNLTGPIPLKLGESTDLLVLDLSWNHLSGHIPWERVMFSGLNSLHLNHNNLSGELPSSLKNCSNLEILDLGENKFYGRVPIWIGKNLTSLKVLRLRANMFTGPVPSQLSYLIALQVLDLAQNHLRGSIPQSFGNFTAMTEEHLVRDSLAYEERYTEKIVISMKGGILEFYNILFMVVSMDLSQNSLSGKIPNELTSLRGLISLNLYGNRLSGNIPDNIGYLNQLQTLDLSRNKLSGPIPSSISMLNFLSHLNLSYNNLYGHIPSSTQLQRMNSSAYIGNQLCGPPLDNCIDVDPSKVPPTDANGENGDATFEMKWIYLGVAPGFIVGFWGVWGVLLWKKTWRIAYFKFFDSLKDYIVVKLTMST